MKSNLNNRVQDQTDRLGKRYVARASFGHNAPKADQTGNVSSLITFQSGVGLIEVMVAVLVLSIAFLGIAALQAVSLSTSNSAMARSMATISSYSILDAMRADSTSAKALIYNGLTPINTANCPAAGATLASYQINQWCTQLGASLSKATSTTGTIVCAASGNCTVTIQFDDSRSGTGGSSTQKINTVAVL